MACQHLMKNGPARSKKGSELLRPFASCQEFSHILEGQLSPFLEAFAEQGSSKKKLKPPAENL